MFGFKRKINREIAAAHFIEHCRSEGVKLRQRLVDGLRHYCDGSAGRPTLEAILSQPMASFGDGKFSLSGKTLLDAHCYALAAAVGLNSVGSNVDPRSQRDVIVWQVSKLIVEADVGESKIGHAPSPWPTPDVHISYAPGTFVGGVPSQQHLLTNRYRKLLTSSERLAMLLISLNVFRPSGGVNKVTYEREDLGHGLIARNRIGYTRADPNQIDEWEDDLEISDSKAALAPLPTIMVRELLTSIETIDPFWPSYSRKYRLSW